MQKIPKWLVVGCLIALSGCRHTDDPAPVVGEDTAVTQNHTNLQTFLPGFAGNSWTGICEANPSYRLLMNNVTASSYSLSAQNNAAAQTNGSYSVSGDNLGFYDSSAPSGTAIMSCQANFNVTVSGINYNSDLQCKVNPNAPFTALQQTWGCEVIDFVASSAGLPPIPVNPTTPQQPTGSRVCTFQNPLISPPAADPYAFLAPEGFYYVLLTTSTDIEIRKTAHLEQMGQVQPTVVWSAPGGSPYQTNILAPQLYYLNNKWYIYASGTDISGNPQHMFVLESLTSDPLGGYQYKATLGSADAVDPSVYQSSDGSLYLLWSQFSSSSTGTRQQCIRMAQMGNPWTLNDNGTQLSCPTLSWEQQGAWVNEAPHAITHNGSLFIFYSASSATSTACSVGFLFFNGGRMLNAGSYTKQSTPCFSQTPTPFGACRASFTKSPSSKEDWMLYQAIDSPATGPAGRGVHMQGFGWGVGGHNWPSFSSDAAVATGVSFLCPQ